jgi:hypothetical protein
MSPTKSELDHQRGEQKTALRTHGRKFGKHCTTNSMFVGKCLAHARECTEIASRTCVMMKSYTSQQFSGNSFLI